MGASVAAFIVAGLIPLGLVLAGWWDARSVLIFYWAELLVMGFFTMCRILLVQTQPVGLRLLLAMFFYGVFFGLCVAYGAMIAKLVGIRLAAPSSLNYAAIIVTNVRDLMRALQPYGWLALLGLIASHAVSFFASYVARGEYRGAEIRKLISRLALRHVI